MTPIEQLFRSEADSFERRHAECHSQVVKWVQVIAVGIHLYNLEAEAYGAKIEACGGDAIPAIHARSKTA